jgi:hypothetical protein
MATGVSGALPVASDKTIFTNHGEFGGFDQII